MTGPSPCKAGQTGARTDDTAEVRLSADEGPHGSGAIAGNWLVGSAPRPRATAAAAADNAHGKGTPPAHRRLGAGDCEPLTDRRPRRQSAPLGAHLQPSGEPG